ncbi:MAG: uroporphyrinogen decarboxylase [Acidimicrobiales bacterium]
MPVEKMPVEKMPAEDAPAFLLASAHRRTDHVPIWFMRQAGRSLPEYRQLRGNGSILDVIRSPEVAAEITLQPVRRYGVDAAILYSDIMVPLAAIGYGVEITQGRGPYVPAPFSSPADLKRLRVLEPELDIPFVIETVKHVASELRHTGIPLVGFAGGPFTVASYLIEGGSSKDYTRTKSLMRSEPALFAELMSRLAGMALDFLTAQVDAGAGAVQVFDSWAGVLSAREYRSHVLPSVTAIMEGLAPMGIPRIYFAVSASHLLELIASSGCDVISIDWRMPLSVAREHLATSGMNQALQGNLDPTCCLAPWEVLEEQAMATLREGGGIGHIFNLGHGVLPGTDPATLERLVDLVHSVPLDTLVTENSINP